MKCRKMISQIVLGVAFIAGGMVLEAQANSVWTYEGSGIDTSTQEVHTVTAMLELDFGPTVSSVTPFSLTNVLNSAFTVSGPNFKTGGAVFSLIPPGANSFNKFTLGVANGAVLPPDTLSCTECLWIYFGVGGGFIQTLSATILNGSEWELVAQVIQAPVLTLGPGPHSFQGPSGGYIFGEFILRGTGEWTPPTITPNPVPEPETVLLFGVGLVVLVGWQMRRKIV